MQGDEGLVAQVAAAILDGEAVDWVSTESSADVRTRALLQHLKALATLAEVHRSAQLTGSIIPEAEADQHQLAAPGDTWGQLRILERIGRGACGEVYRAWDTRLDREVALKLLAAGDPPTADSTSPIIDEGRLLARVHHPNVVTIYGAERIGDRIGLWMEYVRGCTLQQVLEQRPFEAADVVRIGIALGEAVSAVHAAGLLHRDIKPHNVMLAEDGRVVLMDFGTGYELTDDAPAPLAGTPLYLAPELLRGEPASVRSDIYSLGVLLFHLLTGSYPVRGGGIRELKLAHQRGEHIDIRTARPGIRPRLAGVVQRAIDPQPVQRYPNANTLVGDLKKLERRSRRAFVRTALRVAAALLLLLWAGFEWRRHQIGSPGPARLLISGISRFSGVAPSSVDRPAIVVLPFENLSAEPDSDFFVEGLTVEILHSLAGIDGLRVRSRESSFAFRNTSATLAAIGTQLDANLFLQGSVRRRGPQLRVNARLVDSAGTVLWSDQFDRQLKDVFAIEDEISRGIVNRLRLALGRGQRRYNTNPDTYELYLKARVLTTRRGFDGPKAAIPLYQQVIDRDPAFAPAYAGLADAYAFVSVPTYARAVTPEEARAIMQSAATKALELDPMLAEAHAAMGWVYSRDRDWANAEKAFRRAIELNPSLTHAYTSYSLSTLQPLGKRREALRVLDVARRNDPLSLDVQREIGVVQFFDGQYPQAIETLGRVYATDPDFAFVDMYLGRALTFGGRAAEAWPLLDKPGQVQYRALLYVMSGRRDEAEKAAAENQLYPYRQVIIYAALGDGDRALEALERTVAFEPQRVPLLLMSPELAGLRDDPRYVAFRKKFGLP